MARTETVTVVFTDLVGSTELASRLGHDAYETLRQAHFAALRSAVATHNGNEVKTTGDGLMLSFASAADGIACAVALQQATDGAVRRAHRQPLQIRVGVSSGEATHEDRDLYGPPVVEAARLCAAASAGQILVSDVVRVLARGKGHTFTPLGELTLKGLPEPVPASEVRWEPLAAGVPLPPRLTVSAAVAMVGRDAEQEVIAQAWAQAKEGQRRVVLLSGEPGIGKTRLATEAALARHAEGATVLLGTCNEDATRAALVAEVPGEANRFGFSHALIRATLYEELGAARRARLHRKVGEALEALADVEPDTKIDDLAYHWLAATQVADAAKAVGYARQAGDRALAGLAFEEAAAHYERALGVLQPRGRDDELLRCDLLIATAEARRRAGNPQYRETVGTAVELARQLGDAERLAPAALANARSGGFMANANVVDEALVALYEAASAALGTSDNLLRARVLGQLATELNYTPHRERRHALSREAVEIARRLGDRSGLAQVMTLRLIAFCDPFTLAERLALTAELAALAEELGSSELAWHAAFHRAGALLESADIHGTERCVAEMERLAAQLRQPFYTWFAAIGRATVAATRGAPDAEAQALAAFEIGTAGGQPDAGNGFGAQLAHVRWHQGRHDEAIDGVRALAEAMPI